MGLHDPQVPWLVASSLPSLLLSSHGVLYPNDLLVIRTPVIGRRSPSSSKTSPAEIVSPNSVRSQAPGGHALGDVTQPALALLSPLLLDAHTSLIPEN